MYSVDLACVWACPCSCWCPANGQVEDVSRGAAAGGRSTTSAQQTLYTRGCSASVAANVSSSHEESKNRTVNKAGAEVSNNQKNWAV